MYKKLGAELAPAEPEEVCLRNSHCCADYGSRDMYIHVYTHRL